MGRSTCDAVTASARSTQAGGSALEGLSQLLTGGQDSSRLVFVHGDVSEGVIAGVIAQLIHLASTSAAPIHLVISTYGGSVDEMFSLYDAIKFLPCPVYTVGLGKVMSAGVVLLASGAKGKRLIGASSRIMMHPISTGIFGNVFELENQTAEARRMQELMVKLLQRETKMTRKRIEQAIMKPMLDYYITPEQAIADGIVDRVIGAPTKV